MLLYVYTLKYLSRCIFLEKAALPEFGFVQVIFEVTGDSLNCKGKRKTE